MSGIYIHIPFCKQACSYCNFHFSTSMKRKDELLDGLHSELDRRASAWNNHLMQSIYFGGGTPSILETDAIQSMMDHMHDLFEISPDAEVTLEANPDDITDEKLEAWKAAGINRLSLGVQSFREADLELMHRVHKRDRAFDALERINKSNIPTWTADLIYGTPGLRDEGWIENIRHMSNFDVPHLSCYALTVEDRTALKHRIEMGTVDPVTDEQVVRQFNILMDETEKRGYEQYEISNFARPGHKAVHNANYWKEIPYLGIGPSAHSYDGSHRRWNVANNNRYIKAIREQSEDYFEEEYLTDRKRYNEFVMMRLRTSNGIEEQEMHRRFPDKSEIFSEEITPFIEKGWVKHVSGRWFLTRQGKHWADLIASELMETKQ